MDFNACLGNNPVILMEGALGERLKREFGLEYDPHLDMGAFVYNSDARRALSSLWREYADAAHDNALPFIATTPTRRTNSTRAAHAGRDVSIIADNVRFLRRVLDETEGESYAGGMVGSYGDAYTADGCLDAESSRAFHSWEINAFRDAGADFLYAALMPSVSEAEGIARAALTAGLPCIISLTVERNGRLPDGNSISDAIERIDAATYAFPALYMTNCVHPDIAREALLNPVNDRRILMRRFRGIQANTSKLPYCMLDGAADLYTSDPAQLAQSMAELRSVVPLQIFGGCCGTDAGHMRAIADLVKPHTGY